MFSFSSLKENPSHTIEAELRVLFISISTLKIKLYCSNFLNHAAALNSSGGKVSSQINFDDMRAKTPTSLSSNPFNPQTDPHGDPRVPPSLWQWSRLSRE